MKVPKNLNRPLGLAAATTIAIGLAGAVPAQASPVAASASVTGGTLLIKGGHGSDNVTVDFAAAGSVAVELDGRRQSFDRRTFTTVSVSLGSGDDRFRVVSGGSPLTDVHLDIDAGDGDDAVAGGAASDTIFGGRGNDDLRGGSGNDVLFGGRGDDLVDGGVGTDTELLGSGDDVAGWLPGEGNDAVLGQSGTDTLLFDGSAGDEVMSLSANGRSAVFLRSPGSVRMDLDSVERVTANALGGVDSITVNDLSGTDVGQTTIDLSVAG